MQKFAKSLLWLWVVFLLWIVLAFSFLWWEGKEGVVESDTYDESEVQNNPVKESPGISEVTKTEEITLQSEADTFLNSYEKYELIQLNSNEIFSDQQLIGTDSEGSATILIPSTKEAIKSLEPHYSVPPQLAILAATSDKKRVFFFGFKPETDAGRSGPYYFEPKTKTFGYSKMKSSITTSYTWSYAPDRLHFLTIGPDYWDLSKNDGRTLYVGNLETDTLTVIKTLPSGETFRKFSGVNEMAGEPGFDWKWVDAHTVEVSIFTSTYKFLRTEQIKLPQ